MKKQIDELIKEHTEGYQKYLLKCSVKDFKLLQRLMRDEYKIKPYPSNSLNSEWKHNGTTKKPTRIGTVKFDNFELNVTCETNYTEEPVFRRASEVSERFWNSKKE